MADIRKIDYRGWKDCLEISNGAAELVVCVGMGPRVLRYARAGGANFLKNFDDQMAAPRRDEWLSYGGHRLWHAPEIHPRTYYPDVEPVEHDWNGRVLSLRCAVETTTGLQKEIDIEPDPAGTIVRLRHRIHNRNLWPVAFAPWCLTVMAPGGRAVVPQEPFVPHGEGPGESFAFARPLVLWQFTRMNDPRFVWGDRFIQLRQDDRQPSKQKFGALVKPGWAAYALGKELFLKRFPYDPEAVYPDAGCNAEFFTMPGFLEIESLGGLATVQPGACAALDEIWSLHEVELSGDEAAMERQLAAPLQNTQ